MTWRKVTHFFSTHTPARPQAVISRLAMLWNKREYAGDFFYTSTTIPHPTTHVSVSVSPFSPASKRFFPFILGKIKRATPFYRHALKGLARLLLFLR